MPFESSQAQRRWMYANRPEMAKQWEKDTPKGKKLPKHVKGTKLHKEKGRRGQAGIQLTTDILVLGLVFLCFFIVMGGATHFFTAKECHEHHTSQAFAGHPETAAAGRGTPR